MLFHCNLPPFHGNTIILRYKAIFLINCGGNVQIMSFTALAHEQLGKLQWWVRCKAMQVGPYQGGWGTGVGRANSI
jgi:hypothetical protein